MYFSNILMLFDYLKFFLKELFLKIVVVSKD